jgi:hypothetical protein
MKRFIISPNLLFTIGTIIALNIILVYGQIANNCIQDREPGEIECATLPPDNCDEGQYQYKKEYTYVDIKEPDGTIVYDQYVEIIVPTGYNCGGSMQEPYTNWFNNNARNNGESNLIITVENAECYVPCNCDWEDDGGLGGYVEDGEDENGDVIYKYVYNHIQRICKATQVKNSMPQTAPIWEGATWTDCYSEF